MVVGEFPWRLEVVYHFHVKFDTFHVKLNILVNKLDASEAEMNVFQIEVIFWQVKLQTTGWLEYFFFANGKFIKLSLKCFSLPVPINWLFYEIFIFWRKRIKFVFKEERAIHSIRSLRFLFDW